MRTDKALTIGLLGALLICALASFGTLMALDSLHPDPHDYSWDYKVEGNCQDGICSGSGTLRILDEGSPYHNYEISLNMRSEDGTDHPSKFIIVFDSSNVPEMLEYKGQKTVAGESCAVYGGEIDNQTISITVGENCRIYDFSYSANNLSCSGTKI